MAARRLHLVEKARGHSELRFWNFIGVLQKQGS